MLTPVRVLGVLMFILGIVLVGIWYYVLPGIELSEDARAILLALGIVFVGFSPSMIFSPCGEGERNDG